jgi:hypothetical protein
MQALFHANHRISQRIAIDSHRQGRIERETLPTAANAGVGISDRGQRRSAAAARGAAKIPQCRLAVIA